MYDIEYDVEIDESILTGESKSVVKTTAVLPKKVLLADQNVSKQVKILVFSVPHISNTYSYHYAKIVFIA